MFCWLQIRYSPSTTINVDGAFFPSIYEKKIPCNDFDFVATSRFVIMLKKPRTVTNLTSQKHNEVISLAEGRETDFHLLQQLVRIQTLCSYNQSKCNFHVFLT